MVFKKGVSEVVANVLIVLLVIVGVAVLWAVVKPTIQKTSDAVQSDCFTVQLNSVKCEINLEPGSTDFGNVTYTIMRNSGQGDLRQLALSYTGNVIYYSHTLSIYNIAYILSQNQALIKESAQNLDELETINIKKSVINNLEFNFNTLANGISLGILGVTPAPIAVLQNDPTLGVNIFYLPSSITTHPIIGDEGLICDVGTQSIDCSCKGSLCGIVTSTLQTSPQCTSLPCNIILS